jgi:hypothetical protein
MYPAGSFKSTHNKLSMWLNFTTSSQRTHQANCFRAHKELTMDPLGKFTLAPSVTITFRIQANKRISCYHLPWDFNIPQNLRGLLECGVQVNLDQGGEVEGTDNVLFEAIIGYAGSVGTALWYEIKEDCSKVCCHLAGSLFLITDDI